MNTPAVSPLTLAALAGGSLVVDPERSRLETPLVPDAAVGLPDHPGVDTCCASPDRLAGVRVEGSTCP